MDSFFSLSIGDIVKYKNPSGREYYNIIEIDYRKPKEVLYGIRNIDHLTDKNSYFHSLTKFRLIKSNNLDCFLNKLKCYYKFISVFQLRQEEGKQRVKRTYNIENLNFYEKEYMLSLVDESYIKLIDLLEIEQYDQAEFVFNNFTSYVKSKDVQFKFVRLIFENNQFEKLTDSMQTKIVENYV